jgi:hypothetical protein
MTDMVTGFAPQVLAAAEKLARLRLARSENVGPITFRQLLEDTAVAYLRIPRHRPKNLAIHNMLQYHKTT